jgi:hypothetical protein
VPTQVLEDRIAGSASHGGADRIRHDDLTAVTSVGNARCSVHIKSEVVAAYTDGIPGVESDPDPYLNPRRKRPRERALRVDGSRDRGPRRVENRKERVTTGRHLASAMTSEGAAHQRPVFIERTGEAVGP